MSGIGGIIRAAQRYTNPESNGGSNFWSSGMGKALAKAQDYTQPIYDTYIKTFPLSPVAKAFEAARTGTPMSYSPQETQSLAGNIALMGGMKNVGYENSVAKQIGRLAHEASTGLSIDGTHEVYQLAQKLLRLSPKQAYQFTAEELLSDLVSNLSKDQDFVFRQLLTRK